ncbi:MAG: glutathione S-transferase family protein [Acidovorax sp.]|uniref:glutathione S-transferase family protein n=1 Tax=Acidovorax sp. TaxID=1872122 RepID=UPI0022BD393A|nr:glutathione S-transferase family protein [Acidovorax sp.]MCZ8220427.1 glutathione S-transferase family protein [Acidovorax sp.]
MTGAAPALTLVSHALCPYVQRVAIVLHEKGLAFERRTIDLANKPDWFLALSPLGKTPVLQVRGQSLFESAVICEYLDDVAMPALHPQDPLQRARHRAWMEFGSAVLGTIGAFYSESDEAALQGCAQELRSRFVQIEHALAQRSGPGPYFAGADFGMVDAVFGPVFRYFDVIDDLPGVDDLGLWQGLPQVAHWRTALAARTSVRQAVGPDYADGLRRFLRARGSALSRRMGAVAA